MERDLHEASPPPLYDVTLAVRVEHMRRPQASTILFAMAKRALRLEQRGQSLEFFQGHLTIEGDYWGVYGVDHGLTPEQLKAAEAA